VIARLQHLKLGALALIVAVDEGGGAGAGDLQALLGGR
jgi:hypothetical protein